jgi:hypothetical protein
MAQVDTGIYGNLLRPAGSLMDNVNALDASELQKTQLAGAKLNLIGQQQTQADQQAVRALYQRPGFDPSTPQGMTDLSAASPTTALATRKAILDNQKTQADIGHLTAQTGAQNATAATSQFDLARKKLELGTSIVTSAMTPADAHAKFQQAVAQGLMTPQEAAQKEQEVPGDPAGFDNWKKTSALALLSASQRIDAAQNEAKAAETARHNQQSEKNTVRGQDVQASTSRSNNAATIAKDYKVAGLDANGNFTGFGTPGATPTVSPTPGPVIAPVAGPGRGTQGVPAAVPPPSPAGQPSSPLQGLVDSIGNYTVSENTALSRTPPAMKAAILNEVRARYPDYDPGTYAERQASNRAFSANGKSGQAVKSFNVGLAHLDTLSNLADKLDNGSIPVLNAAGNYIAKQTGGDAQTNFEAAKKIVTDEVVKSIVGGGGGVGDREKAESTINGAQTPKQLKGAIKTVQELMGGQLVGLEQSYRAGTGKKDFRDKYLSPEAKRAFDALQQTAPANVDLHSQADAILRGSK